MKTEVRFYMNKEEAALFCVLAAESSETMSPNVSAGAVAILDELIERHIINTTSPEQGKIEFGFSRSIPSDMIEAILYAPQAEQSTTLVACFDLPKNDLPELIELFWM